jgi:CRISPR-associated protein Csd2
MSATTLMPENATMTGIEPYLDASRRHDAMLLFDVMDGNPNGDPDAGNLPRVDPETMQGLVSDVAIKRKVRDYVDATRGNEERFKIYVQQGQFLSDKQERAYTEKQLKPGSKDAKTHNIAQAWMCENFFDIRTFGAVLSVTEYRAGQVRGPVQVTFARSIDPVVPLDLSIVRVALTNAKEERQAAGTDGLEGSSHGTMGRKALVPYGLYRAHVFVSPHLGQRTGFDGADLALLWEALQQMWDLDHSASRGMMACRGLYIYSHDNQFGNAPAHALFDRVDVKQRADKEVARSFSDYVVRIDDDDLPAGVTLKRVIG